MSFTKEIHEGDIVNTQYGIGKVIQRESKVGILSERWKVELEKVPDSIKEMHDKHKGLFFFEEELELI